MFYGRNRKEEGGKFGRKAEEYQETEARSVDDKQMDEKTIHRIGKLANLFLRCREQGRGWKRLAERQMNLRKLKEDLWMTNRWMKRL